MSEFTQHQKDRSHVGETKTSSYQENILFQMWFVHIISTLNIHFNLTGEPVIFPIIIFGKYYILVGGAHEEVEIIT